MTGFDNRDYLLSMGGYEKSNVDGMDDSTVLQLLRESVSKSTGIDIAVVNKMTQDTLRFMAIKEISRMTSEAVSNVMPKHPIVQAGLKQKSTAGCVDAVAELFGATALFILSLVGIRTSVSAGVIGRAVRGAMNEERVTAMMANVNVLAREGDTSQKAGAVVGIATEIFSGASLSAIRETISNELSFLDGLEFAAWIALFFASGGSALLLKVALALKDGYDIFEAAKKINNNC